MLYTRINKKPTIIFDSDVDRIYGTEQGVHVLLKDGNDYLCDCPLSSDDKCFDHCFEDVVMLEMKKPNVAELLKAVYDGFLANYRFGAALRKNRYEQQG